MNVKEAANIETFTEDTTFAVVTAMVHMPNGVQRMNPEIEGLVQTSLNMGILTTEESEVQMTFAVRSSEDGNYWWNIIKRDHMSATHLRSDSHVAVLSS